MGVIFRCPVPFYRELTKKATKTATATKMIVKNWLRTASNFLVLILSRLIRQMLASFSLVEFQKTV